MKKIISIIFVLSLFAGCQGTGSSISQQCLQNVQKTYPQAVHAPGRLYHFIALDKDGSVHYIKTTGEGTKITSDVILIYKK